MRCWRSGHVSDTPRKDVPLAFDRTLRDEMATRFAAAWMSDNATLLELHKKASEANVGQGTYIARLAYDFADAMLKVRG